VKATGIRNANAYMTRFKTNREAMFIVETEVRLDLQSKGGNTYCVPSFRTIGKTDPTHWRQYAQTYLGIRDAITRPPNQVEDEENLETASVTVEAPAPEPSVPTTPTAAERVSTPVIAPPRPATPAPAARRVPAPTPAVPSTPVPESTQEPASQPPYVSPGAPNDGSDLPF
jgi:hypothetical protein